MAKTVKMAPPPNRLNRLNLPNMVDTQLKEFPSSTEVFFNPYTISSYKRLNNKPLPEGKPKHKTSIATSLNSIVATVHNKLKSASKTPKPKSPAIPAPIAETMKDAKSAQSESDTKAQAAFKTIPLSAKSLPQVTASLERKCQERQRHQVTIANNMNMTQFNAQQRAREIIRQKRMLENMLEDHHKLRRDRQSMASEILSMKTYLNEIRCRLDQSLRKLNTKNTICERFQRPHNPAGARHSRSGGSRPRKANPINTSLPRGRINAPKRAISLDARLKNDRK